MLWQLAEMNQVATASLGFLFCPVLLASMDAAQLSIPPQESTDIFSLSDQVLSDSLQFVQEVPELSSGETVD
jgi:hypothetical protein